LLLAGDLALVGRIAEALNSLHGSSVRLERHHGLHDEIAPLASRVQRLASADAGLGETARHCLELVGRRAKRPWPWRWRPIHRDFYHDQVLVTEGGLSILDWDDAAMSEPAVDVANFLAHLRLLAIQRSGWPDELNEVSADFEGRYRQLDDGLDPDLVRFLQGTTLLRLAEIHRSRERGEWVAGHLLEQSELLLAS
jgi:thiamine kinase-like enzyme